MSRRGIMHDPAVGGRFIAFGHAVFTRNGGDAQVVVGEDAGATGDLRLAVRVEAAPLRDGFLIAPEGKGEHLPWLGKTLETLDRDEAVDSIEQRPQLRGDVEVFIASPFRGSDFEDDGDHWRSSPESLSSMAIQ